jgi:hypothetical protein
MAVIDLYNTLKEIENCEDIEPKDGILNVGYIEDCHELVQKAVHLADQLLITPEGVPNFDNIYKLDYCVYPVEKDGFGWLTGGIETEKGTIAFG